MKTQDILLDSDRDLLIRNGDLVIGYSSEQHIELILLTEKGQWKESPLIGVGIEKYINSTNLNGELNRDISLNLEQDDWTIENIDTEDLENINIEATKNEYENL